MPYFREILDNVKAVYWNGANAGELITAFGVDGLFFAWDHDEPDSEKVTDGPKLVVRFFTLTYETVETGCWILNGGRPGTFRTMSPENFKNQYERVFD